MKRRQPRKVLGTVTREDGVRVEVKSPTVWNKLNELQDHVHVLVREGRKVLGNLYETEFLLLGRDLDVVWLLSRRWVRLGIGLRLLRVPRHVAAAAVPTTAIQEAAPTAPAAPAIPIPAANEEGKP